MSDFINPYTAETVSGLSETDAEILRAVFTDGGNHAPSETALNSIAYTGLDLEADRVRQIFPHTRAQELVSAVAVLASIDPDAYPTQASRAGQFVTAAAVA